MSQSVGDSSKSQVANPNRSSITFIRPDSRDIIQTNLKPWVSALQGLQNKFKERCADVQHVLIDSRGSIFPFGHLPPQNHHLRKKHDWRDHPNHNISMSRLEDEMEARRIILRAHHYFGLLSDLEAYHRIADQAWDCLQTIPFGLKLSDLSVPIKIQKNHHPWTCFLHGMAWTRQHPILKSDRKIWVVLKSIDANLPGEGNAPCVIDCMASPEGLKEFERLVPTWRERMDKPCEYPPKWYYSELPDNVFECSIWAIDELIRRVELIASRFALVAEIERNPPFETATVSSPPPPCDNPVTESLIKLQNKPPCVFYAGNAYGISDEQLAIFRVLSADNSWVSSTEMAKAEPTLKGVRIKRQIDRLAEPLRKLIESGHSKGYRLRSRP